MTRRAWGEGSVHPTADGSGWMWSFEVPRRRGQKRKRVRGRARTKTEAQRSLREARAKWAESIDTDEHRSVQAAVGDYEVVRRGEPMEEGTRSQHRRANDLVVAGLGDVLVVDLSVVDCDRFLRSVAHGEYGLPLGRPQLRRLRRHLINVVANEVRQGNVARNVAELSVVPEESDDRRPRREPRAIQLEELQALLAASDGVLTVVVDLGGRNGFRPAEVRGLRWSRLDLDRRTLRVDAQMNRREEITKAKTKRSYRTIRIDERTARRLADWRAVQLATADELGSYWSGNTGDLVVTSRRGTPISQRNVHRSLAGASRRADLVPTVSAYDLRHTAITHQVERGVPVHKIADWAGTSERMIWETYRDQLDEISEIGPIDGFETGWN